MLRRSFNSILIAAFLVAALPTAAQTFPGKQSEWNGYTRYDFEVDGRKCVVVEPKLAADDRPWIWRARFFGHEPQTDLSLLSRGFHLAYMDIGGLFGNEQAVAHWDAFYEYLTTEHALNPKLALEGMSRGGLIIYNWAKANPDKVACIYADAPVCDIRSWPGGNGEGKGSPSDWTAAMKAHGITEATTDAFAGNPIDNLEALAAAKVPILQICGDADDVVPLAENGDIFEARYAALGGPITTIRKEGVGHHPHSLKNPIKITDFILRSTQGPNPYARVRSAFGNAAHIFTTTGKGRVAFLGGSITEMKGWRELTYTLLQEKFPNTEFDFIHAGISSTDSTLAAFRLENDVFMNGKVDLLFMEHAVNDNHNMRTSEERLHGVEGVIRQARLHNPNIDIIMQYCVEPAKMKLFNAGQPDPIILDHERVAQHYNVTTHNLARLVTDAVNRGDFTWEQFKDLHPSPFGHQVYTDAIAKLPFETKDDTTNRPVAYAMPEPISEHSYFRGRYLCHCEVQLIEGWKFVDEWKPNDGAGQRKQFVNVPIIEATTPGATLIVEFSGTAIGMLVTAGPDAGIIEYTIDDGPTQTLDQFTKWSEGLHIPWAYMLATDLDDAFHTLTLINTGTANEKADGATTRIHQFLAN